MNIDAYKSTLDKIVESLEGDTGPSSPVQGPLERIAVALEGGTAPENPYLDPLERIAKVVQEGGGGGGGENTPAEEILDRTATRIVNTKVTSIGRHGLTDYPNLADVYFPNVTMLDEYCSLFNNCPQITEVTDAMFPKLSYLSKGAFAGCSAKKVILSGEITLHNETIFSSCSNLEEIRFPNLLGNSNKYAANMIYQLTALKLVDYGRVLQINNLRNCTSLRTLIFRNTDSVVILPNYNATVLGGIYNNPASSTIYVPQALLSSYENDAKWSLAKNAGVSFAAIEGSEYEL